MQKEKTRSYPLFLFIKWLVRLFYPKITLHGTQHLPQEPCLIVSNHAKMNGPICCELYFPGKRYTWCAGEMMHLKDVPAYAFADFWAEKPKWCRWFYKLLSYIIAPFSVCVFNNADTIPVYHDNRIVSTFKTTLRRLEEGANVVIFPEHDVPYNHIVCDFQDKFIDIARLYHKRTGKALPFVPMYIAPGLKGMYLGEALYFNPDAPIEQERARLKKALQDAVTEIACYLPRHTVVPYHNVPKKKYPKNIPLEEVK